VTVRLTGFNAETLKHFIFLERPQDVQGEDSTALTQDGYERKQAHLGLMPSAQDYATIGHLYEAIRTNLIALDRELGGEGLFLGNLASQVGRSVIDLEGVEPITGLAGAQRAIDIIVEQGEGSLEDREVSHYRSFLTIQRELYAAIHDDADFAAAWPVADSPVLRQPPEPEGKIFIDCPAAAALLDFACATYGLLLRCLVQWRWCMNIVWVASPPQACTLFDTDGDRHAEAGHLVEGVAGDFRFGLLIGQSPGMKTPADDGLVAIHCRFGEAPPAISRATLPSDAAVLLDRPQMIIALRRAGLPQNGG
jgi:hypothetical protein